MTSILQTAERVDRQFRYLAEQSEPSQHLVISRMVRSQAVRAWRLSWDVANDGVAKAVRQHHAQYAAGGEFTYTPPGGSAVMCIYTDGTLAETQVTPRRTIISIEIEEALGSDS